MRNETNIKRKFANDRRHLFALATNCNLFDPQEVTKFVMHMKYYNPETGKREGNEVSTGYKKVIFETYYNFCKYNQIPFDRPNIKGKEAIPIIPTTEQVTTILNHASHDKATIFKIMCETAAEGQELHNTHKNNIDPTQGTISIQGTKGHENGVYKLKPETAEMLRRYLSKHKEAYPFPTPRAIASAWRYCRKIAAAKLCRPDLLKIPLKNLRNYSGAIFYNKTKDPIATKRHMRHVRLQTTWHYIQTIVTTYEHEYTHKTVKLGEPNTIKQIEELADAGFTKLTEADGFIIFRKQK